MSPVVETVVGPPGVVVVVVEPLDPGVVFSEFGVVAHAKGARSARELFGKQEQIQSDRQNCRIDKSDFRCFPTQSPICNRDDGLPFRVADLTISFAKWRSKSIEALGNAWVPQVAFEIFKAIEETYKKIEDEENNVFR